MVDDVRIGKKEDTQDQRQGCPGGFLVIFMSKQDGMDFTKVLTRVERLKKGGSKKGSPKNLYL